MKYQYRRERVYNIRHIIQVFTEVISLKIVTLYHSHLQLSLDYYGNPLHHILRLPHNVIVEECITKWENSSHVHDEIGPDLASIDYHNIYTSNTHIKLRVILFLYTFRNKFILILQRINWNYASSPSYYINKNREL